MCSRLLSDQTVRLHAGPGTLAVLTDGAVVRIAPGTSHEQLSKFGASPGRHQA